MENQIPSSPVDSPRSFCTYRNHLLIVSILLVTFIAFCPVLKAQFLNWGDVSTITDNTNVMTGDFPHLKAMFKATIEGVHSPLAQLSFWIENRFGGMNSLLVHFDNLLLHLLATFLFFLLAKQLGFKCHEALLATLIFALHPTKVETVAWASERKDLLCAVFYLTALIAYLRNKYWSSMTAAVLAGLSSPLALNFPVMLLLIDWFNGKSIDRHALMSKWLYWLIACFIAVGNYFPLSSASTLGGGQLVLVVVWSLVFYIQQFFIPVVFAPFYALPKPVTLFSLSYGISALLFIGMMAGVWLGRKNKLLVFAFLSYLILIVWSLRVDETALQAVVADHDQYLASIGFCLLASAGVFHLYDFLKTQEPLIRHLFSVAVVVLLIGLMVMTFNQNLVWGNSVSLWRYQLKVASHPLAYNQLADALKKKNQASTAEREALYKQAIRKDKNYIETYVNLASLYSEQGRYQDAVHYLEQGAAIAPKSSALLLQLGMAYQRLDKAEESIEVFNRLLKIYPDDEKIYTQVIDAYTQAIAAFPVKKVYQQQREEVLSEVEELSKRKKYSANDYFNLGFLYEQVGGQDEAIRFYKKSLEINPAYEKSLYRLANCYQESGDYKSAMVIYQHLLHYHPKNVLGYLNMGIIYNALGDFSHARMFYQKTISIDPNHAGAYFNLGYLNETTGDLKEALNCYEKAIENNPRLSEAYYNMGNVYAALGQIPEAIASYLKTVSLDKGHQNSYVNLSILSFKSRDFTGALRYLEQARSLGYTPPAEYLKSLEPYRKK